MCGHASTHAWPQVSGDYFQAGLVPARVAYAKYQYQGPPAPSPVLPAAAAAASPTATPTATASATSGASASAAPLPSTVLSSLNTLQRRWTLGEVVSAAARAGLTLVALEEEAGAKSDDAGLPKVFTLVAESRGAL